MNGGYKMIDCTGVDLLDGSAQTVAGIYAAVGEAYKTGKPCFAYNCAWGGNLIMSPVPVMILPISSGVYTATSSTLQLAITSEDSVTVSNLVNSAD